MTKTVVGNLCCIDSLVFIPTAMFLERILPGFGKSSVELTIFQDICLVCLLSLLREKVMISVLLPFKFSRWDLK